MKCVKEVTFTGTRSEVLRRASEWKAANPHVRIIGDCSPAAVTDIGDGPQLPSADARVWSGTIHYEEPDAIPQ